MKIIISEQQEKELAKRLNEETYQMPVPKKANAPFCINPDNVLIVKNYLDNGFKKGNQEIIGHDGFPKKLRCVGMLASDKVNFLKAPIFEEELLSILIEKFKKMFSDQIERELFMKQVMDDWFNDKIGTFGTLSVNCLK